MSKKTGDLEELKRNIDQFFLLINGCFILFMQAGFANLEAGSVRSKNTTNILITNFLDIVCGAIVYWLFGYAFAFGGDGKTSVQKFIGNNDFALAGSDEFHFARWFFQFVFAATAATIVSGAMAERTEFVAYLVYSSIITGFVYPVITHWVCAEGGWLKGGPTDDVKFKDYAGSGVVHMTGGVLALVGAITVGPRIGRFEGCQGNIQGHTVPMVSLGGFILFFGFLALTGGSQASISARGDGAIVARAIVNTVLSGSGGGIMTLIMKRFMTGIFTGNWSLLTTINGGLAGMVAICAGADSCNPWASLVIGLIAGFLFMVCNHLIEKNHIDDPLEAVAVHLGGGLWGIIAVTLFNKDGGLFYEWSRLALRKLGWNLVGAAAISAWSAFWGILIFVSLKALNILRVPRDIELRGLDIARHGEPAYPSSSYGDGWGNEIGNLQAVGKAAVIFNNNRNNEGENSGESRPVDIDEISL